MSIPSPDVINDALRTLTTAFESNTNELAYLKTECDLVKAERDSAAARGDALANDLRAQLADTKTELEFVISERDQLILERNVSPYFDQGEPRILRLGVIGGSSGKAPACGI